MALDEPDGDDDVRLTVDGYNFCIRRGLLERVGAVELDYDLAEGFKVYTERAVPAFFR